MKRLMLLAAVVAMVMAAAVPALAQNTAQGNEANVACVQTAVQNQGDVTQAAASQYGDATNINIQQIAQECNIAVSQVNSVVNNVVKGDYGKKFYFDDYGKKVYKNKVYDNNYKSYASPSAKYQYKSYYKSYAAPSAQYQYKSYAAPSVQYQYKYSSATAAPAAELPETGGSSLIALGAGVLLVAGGLLARRIVR